MLKKLLPAFCIMGIVGCTSSTMMNSSLDSPTVETISNRFENQGGISDDVKKYFVAEKVTATVAAQPVALQKSVDDKRSKKKKNSKKEKVSIVSTASTATTATVSDGYPADYPQQYKDYDAASAKIREKITPNFYIGEMLTYQISYLGIRMGSIQVNTTANEVIAGRTCAHITGHLQSASFYDFIYKIDDKIDSWIDINTMVPVKYSLIQRESKQTVDDLQLFDQDTLKTHFLFYQLKKGKERKINETVYIPRFFYDVFSAVFFARGAELSVGAAYTFPIVDKTHIKIFSMKVLERSSIEVMGKMTEAFKIEAKSTLPGDLKENGSIFFWVSTDSGRKIVHFEANIKLGAVKGELVKSIDGVK